MNPLNNRLLEKAEEETARALHGELCGFGPLKFHN